MSDQADRETLADAVGVYSVDAEDQLQPEDTLVGQGDVLDRGYRVNDTYRWVNAHGVTTDEQSREETIEQRIRQEVPDPYSAYGAPHNESGMDEDEDDTRLGGDDPDSISVDRDFYGGEHPIGRLVEPDEGRYPDRESRMIAREGQPTSWDSPEESAMHYVNDDDDASLRGELAEEEWGPGRP